MQAFNVVDASFLTVFTYPFLKDSPVVRQSATPRQLRRRALFVRSPGGEGGSGQPRITMWSRIGVSPGFQAIDVAFGLPDD